jgi:hypothetical protein
MPYIHVDVDLAEFDDDEIIEEARARGYGVIEDGLSDQNQDLMEIYLKRRLGLPYDHLMDAYIYNVLGKVI